MSSSINEWAELLPDSWQIKPLKVVANYNVSNVDKLTKEGEVPVFLCNYSDVYNNDFITMDIPFMKATATATEILKFQLQAQDVIITKDSESWDDIAIPAFVRETNEKLICGYHLALIRPNQNKIFGKFLFRCLQAKPIRVFLELASKGITRYGLPKGEIGNLYLPIPPIKVQQIIASYLDKETKRIDDLILAKERLSVLLEEKKQALIASVVTKGLDPNVKMKNSGVEWLEDVPEHWEVISHKRVINKVESGVSVNSYNFPKIEGYIGVLKTSAVSNGKFIPEENKTVVGSELERVACPVKKDTIIMSRMNTPLLVGECAYIHDDFPDLFLPDRLWSIQYSPRYVKVKYMAFLLSSKRGKEALSQLSSGTSGSMKNISKESMLNLKILIPPPTEQEQIISFLEKRANLFYSILELTKRSIKLLKERRSSLISFTVTGQINTKE